MIDSNALDEMAAGYVTAALWADAMPLCTCGGDVAERMGHDTDCPAEESGGLQDLTVTAEAWDYVRHLVEAFAREADGHLVVFANLREFDPSEGTVWNYIGHDLRLTSGGHGTGFWDRDPNLDNVGDGEQGNRDLIRFYEARNTLNALAQASPFHRDGGGDVFQISDTTVDFDFWPLDPNAKPGDRWEGAPLTSAQRQAWIESGVVPRAEDTFPVG